MSNKDFYWKQSKRYWILSEQIIIVPCNTESEEFKHERHLFLTTDSFNELLLGADNVRPQLSFAQRLGLCTQFAINKLHMNINYVGLDSKIYYKELINELII